MSDQRLRDLERQARHSRQDEAAYLLARVRSGVLDHDRLAIAAFCGHEPARLALGLAAPGRPTSLGEWVRGLEWWGPEVAVRGFAEACAASVVRAHEQPGYAEQQLLKISEWVRAGTFPVEFEAVFPHSLQAKVLALAVHRQRWCPHHVDASGQEIVRARAQVLQRARVRRGGDLHYNHSDRELGGWMHHLLHVDLGGEERWHRCSTASGWEPPASAFRRLPDRRGIFDRLSTTSWLDLPSASSGRGSSARMGRANRPIDGRSMGGTRCGTSPRAAARPREWPGEHEHDPSAPRVGARARASDVHAPIESRSTSTLDG